MRAGSHLLDAFVQTPSTPETIHEMIEEFDREFASALKMQGIAPQDSVPHAVRTLEDIITEPG